MRPPLVLLSIIGIWSCAAHHPKGSEREVYDLLRDQKTAVILKVLREGDPDQRRGAVGRLGEECLGGDFWSARYAVGAPLQGRDSNGNYIASPRQEAIVSVLIETLGDPSVQVRRMAAYALMHIGPVAIKAIARLRLALDDADTEVCLWSARAMFCIARDPTSAMEASIKHLHDPNPELRMMAIYSLELIGTGAAAARPRIEECLLDTNERVREQAAQALKNL